MRYPDWHKEVIVLLASERPDVSPDDLDANGTYSAHQRGLTPRQFVEGHLPIKGSSPPVAGSVPPPAYAPDLAGQPQTNYNWVWWLLGSVLGGIVILCGSGYYIFQASSFDSEKRTCQTTMQTIANAVQAYKVRHRGESYPEMPDIAYEVGEGKKLEDLNFIPQCPGDPNNHYSVTPTAGGFKVTCTDRRHGSWEDGSIREP